MLLTNIASVLVGFAMFGNLLATTQQLKLPVSTRFGSGLTVVGARAVHAAQLARSALR